ncbi:MAG: M48 family metallopeptidase [Rhodospirillales bacterium]
MKPLKYAVSFNDGKTALRHKAVAAIDGDTLVITDALGKELARWPLSDIRYTDPARRTPPLRLRRSGHDARLGLATDDKGQWLIQHCPNLTQREAGHLRWPTWVAAGILATASLAGIFVYLLPGIAGTVVKLVPPSVEQSIGEQSRQQLLSMFSKFAGKGDELVCLEPAAQAILDQRANELATLMESPFPVRVTVIRMPVVNALTLPGGEIVILSGLLDKAESGDAVIGVLAHEIAHAVRRDPLQVSIKQTGAALLLSLMIGDVFGGAVMSGLTSGLIESGYSRDAEAAADFIAVTALNQLGWTALPLADFVAGIDRENPLSDLVPSFLNSHPSGENRRRDIMALSQGVGRAINSHEWKTLKSMCK